MPNPKHNSPDAQHTAQAPYNFIPLPEKVITVTDTDIPDHDIYTHHTGYIDCTMTTESPTYTRCAQNLEFFKKFADKPQDIRLNTSDRHIYAQFFSLDKTQHPVIPGSSLRGMVRSLVEIAGFGKMQWVTGKRLFYRTMDGTVVSDHYRKRIINAEMGFLRRQGNRYYIKKCQMARVARNKIGGKQNLYDGKPPKLVPRWNGKYHQHRKVWVMLSDDAKRVQNIEPNPVSGDDWLAGVLIITGDAPRRKGAKEKREFVFILPENSTEEIEVSQEIIESFNDDDQITQWQQDAFPKDKPRKQSRQKPGFLHKDLSGEGDPVFFLIENGQLTFLGRAQNFRLPYPNTPYELIPEHLRAPQNKKRGNSQIDLAEAIFGYTTDGGERKDSRAGRVYFTEAHYREDKDGIWYKDGDGVVTPQILSGPKPTTFQHYLVQDGGKGHNPNDKKKLAHYGTATPDETIVRGHKLYWHKGPNPNFIEKDVKKDLGRNGEGWEKDTQHTQIRPVKAGVTFSFKIHFENLRDYELGALLWVLALPDDCRHKIGMGKSLGLGSVKITPRLVLSERRERYGQLFDGDNWAIGERDQPNIAQFKQIFEQFMLKEMAESERENDFSHVERIKMLLTMLRWPGPASEQSRYMTLDDPDGRKFKDRHVLPDPLNLKGEAQRKQGSQSRPQRSVKAESKYPPSPKSQPAKKNLESRYSVNYIFTMQVEFTWNKKSHKVETKMLTGEPAILDMSRKTAKKLQGQTVKLVVVKVKDGVYYLQQT